MQVNLKILKRRQEPDESWLLFNKQADKKSRTVKVLNCLIGTIK